MRASSSPSIREPDFPGGPLAGVALQEALESKAYVLGGSDYCAPGQLVGDFLRGTASTQLGRGHSLVQAGRDAGRSVATHCPPTPSRPSARRCRHSAGRSAASIATTPCSPASRAAPPRRCASRATTQTLQSLNVRGLYPCGEGAGYAGGILSAGVDGIKVAEAVARRPRREDSKTSRSCTRRSSARSWATSCWKASTWCRSCRRRRCTTRACGPARSTSRANTRTGRARSRHTWSIRAQMKQISETRSPQGIAAVVPLLPRAGAAPGETAIYLHEIQDPGNLGTILRTLAWFGNFRCLLSPDSVDVLQRQGGARQHGRHLPRAGGDRCADGYRCQHASRGSPASTCRDSRSLRRNSGNSTATCSATKAAACHARALAALKAQPFTIAGTGAIESLNVAATVNICQYELNRPLPAAAPGRSLLTPTFRTFQDSLKTCSRMRLHAGHARSYKESTHAPEHQSPRAGRVIGLRHDRPASGLQR